MSHYLLMCSITSKTNKNTAQKSSEEQSSNSAFKMLIAPDFEQKEKFANKGSFQTNYIKLKLRLEFCET